MTESWTYSSTCFPLPPSQTFTETPLLEVLSSVIEHCWEFGFEPQFALMCCVVTDLVFLYVTHGCHYPLYVTCHGDQMRSRRQQAYRCSAHVSFLPCMRCPCIFTYSLTSMFEHLLCRRHCTRCQGHEGIKNGLCGVIGYLRHHL